MTNCLINGHYFIQKLINEKNSKITYDNAGNIIRIQIDDRNYVISYHDNGNIAYCLYNNQCGSLLYHFDIDGTLITTTTPMATSVNWRQQLLLNRIT